MPVVVSIVGLLLYLVFMVDWKEFRGVMKEGGWAAIAYYCLLGVFIYAAFVTQHVASHPAAMHH